MSTSKIMGLALVIALAIGAVIVHRAPVQAAPEAAPLTKVALAQARLKPANQFFSGVGELEAASQVQVSAEVGGRVTHINFTSGSRVKAGDILATLNAAPEQAEQVRLQAQVRNAQIILQRVGGLVRENAATQEQLDNARAAYDMARGELQKTVALIAQKTIRAPFDGVLGIRRVNEGQYLNVGERIVSLVNSRTLFVNFALDEQLSRRLNPGQTVSVWVDAYPDRPFQARITALDPLIAGSRTVQVQATLANPEATLRAGMYASVNVADTQVGDVLMVPETAVAYTAYGDTVFIARPDDKQALVVKRVAVKLGERQAGWVQIAEGLQAGDQVVVSGQLKLSDGMPVQATDDTLATRL
ncbi:MAG: Efflux pump periplasmic linker BepF [Pseudomonas sp.]|nr:MAG: Efflux pump periplasmic linker BepF [Pseudomonas sp.]